jgi:hypothetical protein
MAAVVGPRPPQHAGCNEQYAQHTRQVEQATQRMHAPSPTHVSPRVARRPPATPPPPRWCCCSPPSRRAAGRARSSRGDAAAAARAPPRAAPPRPAALDPPAAALRYSVDHCSFQSLISAGARRDARFPVYTVRFTDGLLKSWPGPGGSSPEL